MGGPLTLPADPAAALQAAPKQYVDAVRAYAAPYDAIAYSGMQINGSMEVSQERGIGGTTVTNASAAIADVFRVDIAGTGTVGIQQQTVAPPGFTNSVLLNCTAINTLAGATDHQWFEHRIEGYRWSRLGWGASGAQPVTIGFWIQPPISGTMAVAVQTTVSPYRTYVVDVPVTAAAWQYKTVTIPGDVAGTWPKDNTTGAVIYFVFGVGSGRKTTANTWATQGTAVGTAATTNFFAAGGFTYITGVVVLPGTQAPTAAQSPTIMRPYDQELVTCKRYFQWIAYNMYFTAAGAGAINGDSVSFPQMRAIPTIGSVVIDPNVSQRQTNAQLASMTSATINGAIQSVSSLAGGGVECVGYRFSLDARL